MRRLGMVLLVLLTLVAWLLALDAGGWDGGAKNDAMGVVLMVAILCFCCASRLNFKKIRKMGRRIDEAAGRGGGGEDAEEGIAMRE